MLAFDPSAAGALTVPALFSKSYLDLAAQHGHSPPHVLQLAGIASSSALAGEGLSVAEYMTLIDVVSELMADSGVSIGVEMGWRLSPAAWGPLGAAISACANGHEALALCARYWHFFGLGLTFNVSNADDVCVMEFQTLDEVVPAKHRSTVLEAVIAVFVRSFFSLSRATPEGLSVWFDFASPSFADSVRRQLGDVHWAMPICAIRLRSSLLDEPLLQTSALAKGEALLLCQRHEQLLGAPKEAVADRVRKALTLQGDGYPSLEVIAKRLNMTSRTLRRRLHEHGQGFNEILNQVRRRDALLMLERPAMQVSHIAQVLGYTDPANFTRAFKQWTGLTPKAWRTQRMQTSSQVSAR